MNWININDSKPIINRETGRSRPVLVWREDEDAVYVETYYEQNCWGNVGVYSVDYWAEIVSNTKLADILAGPYAVKGKEGSSPNQDGRESGDDPKKHNYTELRLIEEMFNTPVVPLVSRKECFDIVSEKMSNSATVDALIEKAEILYNFLNQ